MGPRRYARAALCGLLLAALLGGAGAIAARGGAPIAPPSSAASSGSGLFGPVGTLPGRIVATRVGILQALGALKGHSSESLTPGSTRFHAVTVGTAYLPAPSASLGLVTLLLVLGAALAHR